MTNGFDAQLYADLLVEFLPRPAKREAEYDALVQRLDWLMDKDEMSSEEHDLFLLLGALVSDYERVHYPSKTLTPVPV